MKFHINSLVLTLRREAVTIAFDEVNYFWGQMGAGKTSIARLIDYCLAGDIELSPAMQSEFVSVTLSLTLEKATLQIERPRDSDRVILQWVEGEEGHQASIPARAADGEAVPGTGVENLSDMIFWLSGVTPPRVRTSKTKQESDLRRLSIRDLLWYCYLDQDSMDSSFFHLEKEGNTFKQLKSRDVIRYVIGFHDERVAEIEAQLDMLRGERTALIASHTGIAKVLKEVGVDSEAQIVKKMQGIRERAVVIQQEIQTAKEAARATVSEHSVDVLQKDARRLGVELDKLEAAIADLRQSLDNDTRHLNEIETLGLKFRRSVSAKAVLAGVVFDSCPRCAQMLPNRDASTCKVCGQPDQTITPDPSEEAVVDRDIKARATELKEMIARHNASLDAIYRQREQLTREKMNVEQKRNEASVDYDSAYLSNFLSKERERASLLQEADSLSSLVKLARAIESQREQITTIEARERTLRNQLKEARDAAESDAENLNRLRGFYLDCLVRAGVPGITQGDHVEIPTKDFFPYITGDEGDQEQITNFATISSGGKKNLFKSCFAVAMHRVAASLKAPLPELLIIDSAMKNISERENREQFEGFYRMLYELKLAELASTQMILIDKEYSSPPADLGLPVKSRQMRPKDSDCPPLIPYYQGGK
jgi:hypothetical protein